MLKIALLFFLLLSFTGVAHSYEYKSLIATQGALILMKTPDSPLKKVILTPPKPKPKLKDVPKLDELFPA